MKSQEYTTESTLSAAKSIVPSIASSTENLFFEKTSKSFKLLRSITGTSVEKRTTLKTAPKPTSSTHSYKSTAGNNLLNHTSTALTDFATKNHDNTKQTSKTHKILRSTTENFIRTKTTEKTVPTFSTDDLFQRPRGSTIFEKAIRSSLIPTETSTKIDSSPSPTTVSNLRKTSRNINEQTSIPLKSVQSTVKNSITVPLIASSTENQFSSVKTSKPYKILRSTANNFVRTKETQKTVQTLGTEDLFLPPEKSTIFAKVVRSSVIPTGTSSEIVLSPNPTVSTSRKIFAKKHSQTPTPSEKSPKRIPPTPSYKSTTDNNLLNDFSSNFSTNPPYVCRTEDGQIIKYHGRVDVPFRDRFIYTAQKVLPAQIAVGAVFFIILLILKRFRII